MLRLKHINSLNNGLWLLVPENQLVTLLNQYKAELAAEEFDKAAQLLGQFDAVLKNQPELLKRCSAEELALLSAFAGELFRSASKLEAEAAKLVDQLSPFNKNSSLNKIKYYRNE